MAVILHAIPSTGPKQQRDTAAEAQLLPQQQPVAGHEQPPGRRCGGNILTLLGFSFLTFNSAMAVYRSKGDRAAIAFVGFSYVDLVALFVCLRRYETAEPGSQLRDWLKVAVWLLTTALTMAFSYKVAAIMPVAVAVLVWVLAFGIVAGGFYAFFCYEEKERV